MLWRFLFASLTVSSSLLVPREASSDEPAVTGVHPYAPVKHPKAPVADRDTLKFILKGPYPEHGVMLARGSFLSSGASWTIVDFDAHTMVILQTMTQTSPGGEHEAIVSNKRVVALQPQDLNTIIDEANRIWDPPSTPGPVPSMVTDVTCDLVLFDDRNIVHDSGSVCQSVRLIAHIDAISRERR